MYYDCELKNKSTLKLRLLISLSYYQYPVSLLNFFKVYHKTSKCLKTDAGVIVGAIFQHDFTRARSVFNKKTNYSFENNEKKVTITN